MGMSKKFTAVLAAVNLLILSASPAVFAAPAETAAGSDPLSTLRIEAENAVSSNSTTGRSGNNENASGGKFWDYTVEGGIVCFGDYDLTGLTAITLAVAHDKSGVKYGFYIDGTKGELGLKIAEITGQSTGSFSAYGEFSADILASVPAAWLAGTHTLFMKVESTPYAETVTSNRYGGNIDYLELTQSAASSDTILQVEEQYEAYKAYSSNQALKTFTPASKEELEPGAGALNANAEAWLDGTYSDQILCLGEADLTDLQAITVAAACNNSGLTYAFYIDGIQSDLGTRVAEVPVNFTGGWFKFKELSAQVLDGVSAAQLTGSHMLYLKIESESGQWSGNIDYVTLRKAQPTGGSVFMTQAYNFVNDINTGKSSSSGYSRNAGKNCIENTKGDEIILAYDNVRFDNLKGMALQSAPEGKTAVDLYKGDPGADGALIDSFTLDNTDINGSATWYDETAYRTTPYTFPSHQLTGTDTLYIKLTRVSTYAGNFRAFTLFYDKPAQDVELCTVEAENYVWGYNADRAATDWNWNGTGYIGNTRSGDVFYLGRMDTSTLQQITVKAATGGNQAIYTFYADMDVAFDQMTHWSVIRDKYSKTGDAEPISGGTVLGSVTITKINNTWEAYNYFTGEATPLEGEHEIYMKLTLVNGTVNYTGNCDFVRFIGAKPDTMNTVSNMLGVVEPVGGGTVSAPSNLAFNGTTTLTAAPTDGYTLAGWTLNGQWRTADGTTLSDVAVDAQQEIRAYFVKTGSEKLMLFYAKGKLFDLQIVAADLASVKSTMAAAQSKVPDIYGYEFSAWSESDTDLEIYLGEEGAVIPVSAYYKQVDSADYTVSVTNATASHSGSLEPSPAFNARFDDRITVTAAEGNGLFRYWLLDGMVVSFDTTYTFYVSGDNAVTAVFDTTPEYDSTQTADTVRVMIKKAYVSAEKDQPSASKWTVIPQLYVPSSAEILDYGVYFAPDNEALATIKATGSLEGLTEGTDYIRAVSSSKLPNRQYMISLRHIKEGRTRQAMAYVTVKNAAGDTVTVYSDCIRQVFSAANG